MRRQGGDPGYKVVMRNEREAPQDAVERARLTNWPAERII
jgi:hypothetical protein